MNGLKFIRTQSNISLSNLAMALGVSRQMVSAWENDKKELLKRGWSSYLGIRTVMKASNTISSSMRRPPRISLPMLRSARNCRFTKPA